MKELQNQITLLLALATIALVSCNDASNDKAAPADIAKKAVPIIVAEQSEFNWGKVEEGEVVEHLFKVKNKGDGILEIKKATSS